MKLERIAIEVNERPWLITGSAHAAIRAVVARGQLPARATADQEDDFRDAMEEDIRNSRRREMTVDNEGIAHIYATGIMARRVGALERSCGVSDTADIHSEILSVMENRARGIFLHIDSPGGSVAGIPELAAAVSQATRVIPVVAYTDELMASAAYYIAAGSSQVWAASPAEVGSIGVYIPWVDTADRYVVAGIKPDPIVSEGADLKATGITGRLTSEQRKHLQEMVNETASRFRTHVENSRGDVDLQAFRGQTFEAPAAMSIGLIDHIGSERDAYDTLLGMAVRRESRRR